ncbi:MAG: hypothetical protein ACLUDU_01230 [Butyricimonas faecihominis]
MVEKCDEKDKSDAYRQWDLFICNTLLERVLVDGSASVDFSQSNSNIFSPSWLDASAGKRIDRKDYFLFDYGFGERCYVIKVV